MTDDHPRTSCRVAQTIGRMTRKLSPKFVGRATDSDQKKPATEYGFTSENHPFEIFK